MSRQEKERRRLELLGEIRKANAILEGGESANKAAALSGQDKVAKDLAENDEAIELDRIKEARKSLTEARDAAREEMAANRRPSKAGSIGSVQPPFSDARGRVKPFGGQKPHPFMKAAFRDYQPGEFLSAVLDKKGVGWDGDLDPSIMAQGKQKLAEFAAYGGIPVLSKAGFGIGVISEKGADPEFGKATLGTTGATGGYVLPNNLVDTVVKPATQKAVYQQLVTTINGVAVRGVDQPYRLTAASRATFIDWGSTKSNTNESYGTYSAVLGTIAIIYDIGKQYARFSAGSAEQDVMDEITRGVILGENYYIAVGAGTGSVGTGDPTAGVYTQLNAATPTYTTAFSAVATTILGSFAEALTTASGALASRSRESQGWVTDATTFWTIIGQGTNTAGFWVSPTVGPTGFTRTNSGGLAFWGQPIYYDANFDSNSGTTKVVIGGEWDRLKLYRGMEFRIDTTDVAGDRWDKNLIGFRGEEEIGFHAGTAVAIGAMQLITGAIA